MDPDQTTLTGKVLAKWRTTEASLSITRPLLPGRYCVQLVIIDINDHRSAPTTQTLTVRPAKYRYQYWVYYLRMFWVKITTLHKHLR
jgi:hypothetical protein